MAAIICSLWLVASALASEGGRASRISLSVKHGERQTAARTKRVRVGQGASFTDEYSFLTGAAYAPDIGDTRVSATGQWTLNLAPPRYKANGDAYVEGDLWERQPGATAVKQPFSATVPAHRSAVIARGMDGSDYVLSVDPVPH